MTSPREPVEDIFQGDGRLRLELLTDSALEALRQALQQTRETRWDSVRSPHVFMGLLAAPDAGVSNWAERIGEDLADILAKFQELFRQSETEAELVLAINREFLSDNVIRLLRDAYQRAVYNQRSRIAPMDLLISLLTAPNSIVAECFESIGKTAAKLTELAVIAEHQARPS
jgi:ATP-dependent Clp protease ATP-binding subunit ClpA